MLLSSWLGSGPLEECQLSLSSPGARESLRSLPLEPFIFHEAPLEPLPAGFQEEVPWFSAERSCCARPSFPPAKVNFGKFFPDDSQKLPVPGTNSARSAVAARARLFRLLKSIWVRFSRILSKSRQFLVQIQHGRSCCVRPSLHPSKVNFGKVCSNILQKLAIRGEHLKRLDWTLNPARACPFSPPEKVNFGKVHSNISQKLPTSDTNSARGVAAVRARLSLLQKSFSVRFARFFSKSCRFVVKNLKGWTKP